MSVDLQVNNSVVDSVSFSIHVRAKAQLNVEMLVCT